MESMYTKNLIRRVISFNKMMVSMYILLCLETNQSCLDCSNLKVLVFMEEGLDSNPRATLDLAPCLALTRVKH